MALSLPSPSSLLKPAAHLRKELSKLPCEAARGNQLSCFLKCAVEFLRELPLARRNLKYQTPQIFSSRPREAKNSRKLNRTHDETAELVASRDSLLSSFLKCAAGLKFPIYSRKHSELGRSSLRYREPVFGTI